MIRLGILASGEGTNLQALVDASRAGQMDAAPVIVISNNSASGAMGRAREHGIATCHLSARTHPDAAALDVAMCNALIEAGVDLVITAGYMKRLGPATLDAFSGRIVNIHPSLLPRHGGEGMYGMNVHRAVIAAGDTITGITIHYVEGDYDTGPVIAQREVPVKPDDTPESLAARVLDAEHVFIVDTVAAMARG